MSSGTLVSTASREGFISVKQCGSALAEALTLGGGELVHQGTMFFHRERAGSFSGLGFICGLHTLFMLWVGSKVKSTLICKKTVVSGGHGHTAGVGDFILGNLPDLIRQQRDDGESFAGEGHEFNRAALAAFVDEHDRADVVLGQAMLRQV